MVSMILRGNGAHNLFHHEAHLEFRPTWNGPHRDVSMVPTQQPPGDVQAETGALFGRLGREERIENIEADIDAALEIGVDYVILDGRGGGTGAAPNLFKDNISVPTLPALTRARCHLDQHGSDVSLVITGGLRTASDFVKALALGADAVAVANSTLQAIGCLGMRACHTNNCPVGIATQKPTLRDRLIVETSATRLKNFLLASVELMTLLARACGHARLADLSPDDLTTWSRDIAYLTGVRYAGVVPLDSK